MAVLEYVEASHDGIASDWCREDDDVATSFSGDVVLCEGVDGVVDGIVLGEVLRGSSILR